MKRRLCELGGLGSIPKNWTMKDENDYRGWRNKLPDNLKYTNDDSYDMRRAWKSGIREQYNPEDKHYHMFTRNPKTGRILKSPHHSTYLLGLLSDAAIGYYPKTNRKTGVTTTKSWKGNERLLERLGLREGGKIHIKPENRGKFTATMKRTGKTAEELSHSSNPLTRKRAIFALNARKWNNNK